ncbi:unnamed protein product [Spirodela intermedia]|uniref:Uncharacterized protein n=2 Tax=Spirodela intermedia TaxID=51605 RepID=A0A7I8IWK2_SPIIN|nr:unnamed protein product [Spirodela intermedia]CAA6661964.1 unnamed protein product [Spirodela intermedia]CAA7398341.1 unnamed protein product [Spirodela intermedia]
MEEREFRKLLDLFPILNERPNAQTEEEKEDDAADPFWEKLKSAAEIKVGPEAAAKFCKAFQTVHKKVSEDQNSEVIRRYVDATSRSSSG